MRYRILGPDPGITGDDWTENPNTQEQTRVPNGKPKLLFLLLASSIGRMVSLDEIYRVLWTEDADLLDPKGAVQGVVSDIRRLGVVVEHDQNAGSYRLPGVKEEVDANVLIDRASAAKKHFDNCDYELALEEATQALKMWSGPLLRGFTASSRGEVLGQRYQSAHDLAVHIRAGALLAVGRPADSVQFLETELQDKASVRDPEVWTDLIRAIWATGDRDGARAMAGKAEIALRKEGTPIPESLRNVRRDVANNAIISVPPVSTSSIGRSASMRSNLPQETRSELDFIDPSDMHEKLLSGLLNDTPCHPGFHIFFVSGISAAGKDTIVALAADRISPVHRFDTLRKFTTRPRRDGEQEYSISVDEATFERMLRDGQVAFPYVKRKKFYGFDSLQLADAMSRGSRLVAVFTEVDELPLVVEAMTGRGIACTPIFIDASVQHVVDRTQFRGFNATEFSARIQSVHQDLARIRRRGGRFLNEYAFVRNGNDTALESAIEEFLQIVVERLEGRRDRVTEGGDRSPLGVLNALGSFTIGE